jgi:nucleoside-diphosphate-sugar epimerase
MLAGLARGRFTYPGRGDVPHAWAYLPDMARAAVLLAERREELGRFEDVPFAGLTLTGDGLAEALSAATGLSLRRARFPWWQLQLARPVWPMARHLLEMRYLWDTPHWLDGARFAELCPEFRATSAEEALAAAAAPLLPRVPAQGVADHSMARSTQTSL